DPLHNRGRHSLHNHFVVKSLDLTRPGGLVAVVTSRFTLDARNPAARRDMAERADLVGALRLPAGALRAAAGTDAVADLLILRRREPDRPSTGARWERTTSVGTPDGEVAINEYLARHPERVLGELRATGGQYSSADLTVRPDERPLPVALGEALAGIVAEARSAGLTWSPGALGRPAPLSTATSADRQLVGAHPEGSIVVTRSGSFARVAGGEVARYEVKPRGDAAELRALIGLRKWLDQLLALEATSADDEACAPARDSLNRRYDAYVDRYGALNRFSLVRTGQRIPTPVRTSTAEPAPPWAGSATIPPTAR
ncbi:MAG: helicase, partial [Actinobacteria bacterium]|nr:helicase [Actinomycetota bacterium]